MSITRQARARRAQRERARVFVCMCVCARTRAHAYLIRFPPCLRLCVCMCVRARVFLFSCASCGAIISLVGKYRRMQGNKQAHICYTNSARQARTRALLFSQVGVDVERKQYEPVALVRSRAKTTSSCHPEWLGLNPEPAVRLAQRIVYAQYSRDQAHHVCHV